MCNKNTLILHFMTPLKVKKKATNNVLILHRHRPQRNFVTLLFPLDLLGHEGCNKACTMFMTFNYPEKRLASRDLTCSNFFIKNDIIKPCVPFRSHLLLSRHTFQKTSCLSSGVSKQRRQTLRYKAEASVILSLFQTAFSAADSLCSQALSRDK